MTNYCCTIGQKVTGSNDGIFQLAYLANLHCYCYRKSEFCL